MVKHDMPWPLAGARLPAARRRVGAWQGFFIAYVGIPSFIVTLAGMLLFRGVTEILLEGQTLGPFPEGLQKIGNGFLPEVGPNTNYHNLTVLLGLVGDHLRGAPGGARPPARRSATARRLADQPVRRQARRDRRSRSARSPCCSPATGAPDRAASSSRAAGRLTATSCATTVIGRHIYAIGGNLPAAKLSGVKDKQVTFLVFVNMGVLAALAGLVFAARLNAGTPKAGLNFELEAIAAAFIGGASMSGGVGTVLGAIIGGLVLGVLNNGMNLVGIGTDWQQVIKGLVLLAAVGFDVWNKRRGGS